MVNVAGKLILCRPLCTGQAMTEFEVALLLEQRPRPRRSKVLHFPHSGGECRTYRPFQSVFKAKVTHCLHKLLHIMRLKKYFQYTEKLAAKDEKWIKQCKTSTAVHSTGWVQRHKPVERGIGHDPTSTNENDKRKKSLHTKVPWKLRKRTRIPPIVMVKTRPSLSTMKL